MLTELTVHLDLRVFTEEDATAASTRLTAAGFKVRDWPDRAAHIRRIAAILAERGDARPFAWPADANVLSVSIDLAVDADDDTEAETEAAVDIACSRLEIAIATIEHDPEIQWQVARLDSIGPLSDHP